MSSSEQALSSFFGGQVHIETNVFDEIVITIQNDDLQGVFCFWEDRKTFFKMKGKTLQRLIDKYTKQLEIEKELITKGVL